MSKHSFKDYASASYYQYSNHKENACVDKGINATETPALTAASTAAATQNEKKYVSKSTGTESNNFHVNSFSKQQLLSSRSLYNENTSLVSESTETDLKEAKSNNSKSKTCETIAEMTVTDNTFEANLYSNKEQKYSCTYRHEYKPTDESELSGKKETPVAKSQSSHSWVFKFSNYFDDDQEYMSLIKAGPKRSTEWSIFKNQTINSSTQKDLNKAEHFENKVF